jgi:CRISPR/Cas system CMR subunit Cmr6 (Cas7 group RAMP superfamily)
MSAKISINFYFFDFDSSNFIVIKTDKYNSDFNFVRKMNKNIFVQTTIISYDRKKLKNDTLWEQFKKNFVDWIENDFKEEILNIRLKRLRNVLRKRNVWILKDSQMIIVKFLIRILEEEHLTLWIEEKIVNNVETFNSNVIKCD